MMNSKVNDCSPIASVFVVVPKQSMSVPFAALRRVPLGPESLCCGVGGIMESSAPPSTSHCSFVRESLMCKIGADRRLVLPSVPKTEG